MMIIRINLHTISKLKRIFTSLGLQKQILDFKLTIKIVGCFNRWVSCEGKPGLDRAKTMSNYFIRRLMGKDESIPLSSKYMSMINRALILSSHSNLAAVYWASVFLSYRLIRIPVSYDTSTITSGYKGSIIPLLLISRSFTKVTSSFSSTFVEQNWSAKWKWHISASGGPNGHTAYTRYLDDIYAVRQDCLVYSLVFFILVLPLSNKWSTIKSLRNNFKLSELKGDKEAIHSRLAFLSDKGGKTRVVALVDILSQSSLKLVHQRCNRILRRLEDRDGTFDQDKLAEKVKKMSENNVFLASIDLSAATDRLPALYQVLVLIFCRVLTPLQSLGWWFVTTRRSFVVKTPQGLKSIRYRVGQPMGALSSWPVMAISHHVLVKLSYYLAHGDHHNDDFFYAIIGDDLVIACEKTSEVYLKLISHLGVDYSADKSLFLKGKAEFAKRLFRYGEELTPFPLGALSFNVNTFMTNTQAILAELSSRKWKIKASSLVGLSPTRWRRLAELTMLSPRSSHSCLDLKPRDEHGIFLSFMHMKRVKFMVDPENIYQSTARFIYTDPTPHGGRSIDSPYIQIGQDNSNRYPRFRGPTLDATLVPTPIVGFEFLAYDTRVWARSGFPSSCDVNLIPQRTWEKEGDDKMLRSSLLEFDEIVPGYFTRRCVGPQVGQRIAPKGLGL